MHSLMVSEPRKTGNDFERNVRALGEFLILIRLQPKMLMDEKPSLRVFCGKWQNGSFSNMT